MPDAPTIAQPTLSLPRGGGALRGLGGTLGSGSFSGGATFAVPVPVTPARELTPDLAVSYSSAGGNGPLGMGMAIDLPRIARRTSAGVPRYEESDTFALSGAGPLTPALHEGPDGWRPAVRTEVLDGVPFQVRVFRPRAEGELPRIEQWQRAGDAVTHWLVRTADNVTSRYGVSDDGRVADPADPARVAEWLIEESVDARGNRIVYDYRREDGAGVAERIFEQGRVRAAQRYPARIRYGNHLADGDERFALEVVFDYGERDLEHLDTSGADPYAPVRPWAQRADPFSSYLTGFEIRTSRLCRAVLMFHRFPEQLGSLPCLVGALRFTYAEGAALARVTRIVRSGHRRQPDGSYLTSALPQLDLTWSEWAPPPAPRFSPLRVPGAAPPPGYLERGDYQPVDLDCEGLPGLLYSDDATTLYYEPHGEGAYARPAAPCSFPVLRDLRDPRLSLEDLDGDGRLELVLTTPSDAGCYPREEDGRWRAFTPFARTPTALAGARGELVDLDGSGRSDLMLVQPRTVVVYPSEGARGFSAPLSSARVRGFPATAAEPDRQLVTFAGIFGDGLTHRVRVADGEVEVWPSLGRGRFAAPVRLAGAPAFAPATAPERIFFADVDGSGTADLVFAYANRLEIHINQAGNAFGPALTVPLPVELSALGRVSFADVLGTGTTSVLLTGAAPELRHWFCDLCEGGKPYLLTGLDDNVGVSTQVTYAPSTRFYLQDKRAGRPWSTRLPFPVQVVEKVTILDEVAGTRTARRHRYRDGWFDPVEREFRGFGFVESWDAETFAERLAAAAADLHSVGARAAPPRAELHAPPVHTKCWFHVGSLSQSAALRAARHREQFAGDPDAYVMPDSVLDAAARAAGSKTLREAYAALDGRTLRAELYGEDGTEAAAVPYAVTDSNYTVRTVQPAAGTHGSFHVQARETLTADYERDACDPRIAHAFGLELTLFDDDATDAYRELSCTIHYPRRAGAPGPGRVPEQEQLVASVEESLHTRVLEPFRLVGMVFEQRTLDVGGIAAAPGAYLSFDTVRTLVERALAAPIPYGAPFTGAAPQSRPATWQRRLFWDDAQTAALPLGQIAARALAHHDEHAVFSTTWLDAVYAARVTDEDLLAAGYVLDAPSSTWWNPGLVERYHGPGEPGAFFLALETVSPAALDGGPGPFARMTVAHDAPYALRPVEVGAYVDPTTSLRTVAEIDYQALHAWQLTDANGIVHQALLDPLGAVLAASVFKPAAGGDPRVGDGNLRDYVVPANPTFADVLAEPARYLQDAGAYFFADLHPWAAAERRPLTTVEVQRPRYVSQGAVTPQELAIRIAYWDGTGREAATLDACDPGEQGAPSGARWILSGRVVYDNKNRPVEEFLPRYAATPELGPWGAGGPPPPAEPLAEPPPQVTRYDPLGRAVRVDTPKGFFSKVEHTAWEERRYDADDTVLESRFYAEFMGSLPPDPTPDQRAERDALEQAARAYNTPAVTVLDAAARAVRHVQDNLGEVQPERLEAIVHGTPVSARELWTQLVAQGYLVTRTTAPLGTWLGERFDPYAPGFVMRLDAPYEQFADAATELLRQGRLTDLRELDPQGRAVRIVDPRLYLREVRSGTPAATVRCAYEMGSLEPALSVSADAGSRWVLLDVLGGAASSWDSRGLRVTRSFDGLRRPCTVSVTGEATRLRERLTYGEHQPEAARRNLIGQLYLLEDGAGVLTTPEYGLDGRPLRTIRQFAADFRSEPDWSTDVPLAPETYTTRLAHDAFGELVAQSTPDGSTARWSYHRSGRLAAVTVDPAGGGARIALAGAIGYDALGQRRTVTLGNGAVQASTYEDTTQRLLALRTTGPAGATLQDVRYTFDPVGNVTLVRDATATHAFCTPQPVSRCDCSYDPLYRLRRATGLQLPGIEATTYATGFKQTVFAPLCPTGTPAVALEAFVERYCYDDAGNLLALEHTAPSASYSRRMPVLADSNRLQGVPYDETGNTLQIQLTGPVELAWSERGALACATPAAGARTFMAYDAAQSRARKVLDDGTTLTERRYLGDCLIDLMTSAGASTSTATLRIGDGAGTIAVLGGAGAPGVRFELGDRLGSVAVELDGAAAVVGYEAFLPYGGSAAIAAADEAAIAPKTFRFIGKECDDSTALCFYGARYATSWLGRWLSPDPGGPADGLNLYAFLRGNPVTLVDRDGHNGEQPDWARWVSLYRTFQRAVLSSIVNSPRVFAMGVVAYLQWPFLTQEQRQPYERRRIERRHFARESLSALGLMPYVPALIRRPLEAGPRPLAMLPAGSPYSPLQLYLRYAFDREEFAAAYAGGWIGQWLTVSTGLSWLSQAALGTPRTWGRYFGRWGVVGALSFNIVRAGRAAQALEDERAQQQRLAQLPLERGVSGLTGWFTGLPITLAYRAGESERGAPYANVGPGTFVALVALLVGARYGAPRLLARLWRQPSPVRPQNALALYQPPVRALVSYRPPTSAPAASTPTRKAPEK